jgi:signal transduction histidine kinase
MDWQFAFERSEVMRAFQQELLVSIGHELRNPLSSQMGALQLVLSNLCDSREEERECLQSAKEAVERLLMLLEEYTRLARHDLPIQPLRPRPTRLRPLLQEIHSLTRLQAQDRGIRYDWTCPPVLLASRQPHCLGGSPWLGAGAAGRVSLGHSHPLLRLNGSERLSWRGGALLSGVEA